MGSEGIRGVVVSQRPDGIARNAGWIAPLMDDCLNLRFWQKASGK
jgi:hypothetical protein